MLSNRRMGILIIAIVCLATIPFIIDRVNDTRHKKNYVRSGPPKLPIPPGSSILSLTSLNAGYYRFEFSSGLQVNRIQESQELIAGSAARFLLKGVEYELQVSVDNCRPARVKLRCQPGIDMQGAIWSERGTQSLWRIEGSVLECPDNPTASNGAYVRLAGNGAECSTRTAASGDFDLTVQWIGETSISIESTTVTAHLPSFELVAGKEGFCTESDAIRYDPAFPRPKRSFVLVREASLMVQLKPVVANARIVLHHHRVDSSELVTSEVSDQMGRIRFNHLRPGKYSLRRTTWSDPLAEFQLSTGEEKSLTVESSPTR